MKQQSIVSGGGAAVFGLHHPDRPTEFLHLEWTGAGMNETFVPRDRCTLFDTFALASLLKNDHYNMLKAVQLKPALWAA
jgi:hypothetical protein